MRICIGTARSVSVVDYIGVGRTHFVFNVQHATTADWFDTFSLFGGGR
jgi:hypothetical protein